MVLVMQFRALGCPGGSAPARHLPGLSLDGTVLLEAGSFTGHRLFPRRGAPRGDDWLQDQGRPALAQADITVAIKWGSPAANLVDLDGPTPGAPAHVR